MDQHQIGSSATGNIAVVNPSKIGGNSSLENISIIGNGITNTNTGTIEGGSVLINSTLDADIYGTVKSNNGNVEISAADNINVTNSITAFLGSISLFSNTDNINGGSIILDAASPITTTSGNIDLTSMGDYFQDNDILIYGKVLSDSGNITVNSSRDLLVGTGINLLSKYGETLPSFTPSNQRSSILSSLSGNTSIHVEDDLFVIGGSAIDSNAQIGRSDVGTTSNITITSVGNQVNNGSLYVLGGTNGQFVVSSSYAQIGHGGYNQLAGDRSGNISINSVAGDVNIAPGNSIGTYAQIGHGGLRFKSSGGSISGEIMVNAMGDVNILGSSVGSEVHSLLGFGGGANGTYGPTSILGKVNVQAQDINIQSTSNFGTQGHAMLGVHQNTSTATQNIIEVDVNATATGNISQRGEGIGIYRRGASAAGSYAKGNVEIMAGGDIDVYSFGSVLGVFSDQKARGNISVTAGNDLTIQSRTDPNSIPVLGLISAGVSAQGNVDVVVGGDLTLSSGSSGHAVIGQYWSDLAGSTNISVGGNLTLSGTGGGYGQAARILGADGLSIDVGGNVLVSSPSNFTSDFSSTNGSVSVLAGGDISFVSPNTQTLSFVYATADLFLSSAKNITFNGWASSATGETIFTANNDLNLINSTLNSGANALYSAGNDILIDPTSITTAGDAVFVVDNANPFSIGNGTFSIDGGSSINAGGRVLLYTVRPEQNFIDPNANIQSGLGGTFNQSTFATSINGPYANNQFWGAFYGLASDPQIAGKGIIGYADLTHHYFEYQNLLPAMNGVFYKLALNLVPIPPEIILPIIINPFASMMNNSGGLTNSLLNYDNTKAPDTVTKKFFKIYIRSRQKQRWYFFHK